MNTLIVTRHPGAINFLQRKGFSGDVVDHFEPSMAQSGMTVIGVLPVHLIAQVLESGCRYIQIILPQLPPEMRGKELTPSEMEEYGGKLVEVTNISLREIL